MKMDSNWFQNNFLVIDKVNDFFYFKDMKSIAKYYDLSVAQVSSIIIGCRKCYLFRSRRHKLYIQCLYNNTLTRQPTNPQFIWDINARKEYNRQKYQSEWN